MADAEYDRLHDAFDALFPGKVRGCRNGKRETMQVPAFRKEGRIARKDAMKILRDHLQDLLHGSCRDCETGDPEFYMTSRELWRRALAGTYRTGVLCLRCLARRLAPRQLFAEDLSDGTSGVGSLPSSNDWEWTDPTTGTTFQMRYRIRFPSREGPPQLRCTMDFSSDGDEPPEAFLDACDDRVAWLSDYCREHELDLVINDETVLRRGREVEA